LNDVAESTTEATKSIFGESTTAQTCTPAVLVLIIGAIIVIIDIVNKKPERAGYRMTITFILAAIILVLCLLGLGSVSWLIFLLPVVLVGGFIVIVILTLILTTRQEQPITPIEPEPEPEPEPTEECKKDTRSYNDAYEYVMTGKGFMNDLSKTNPL
jgi:Ca2+/Na+ antiporter